MKHLDVFSFQGDYWKTGDSSGNFLGMRIKGEGNDGVIWIGDGVKRPAWEPFNNKARYKVLFNLGEVLEEVAGKL